MIITEAKKVLKKEAESLLNLMDQIGPDFERMVETILSSTGRVIVAGIGKSGLIGRKIVATLTSTGTNAMFLHPVEAMHGDLGMVAENDVFLAISNSGETGELNILLPSIRKIGCAMIAFTGNNQSTMAGLCDIIINTGVKEEACPLGLAPTCSTTAQLAMGDALAVVLINKKHFQARDFKRSHPGGALGQRLSCQVGQVMTAGSNIPTAASDTPLMEAIKIMEKSRLGAVMVLDDSDRLAGIVTDGDVRHLIAVGKYPDGNIKVDEVMTKAPRITFKQAPLYDALNLMEKIQITVLPVVDEDMKLEGFLHLHDILGKGAFTFNGS